MKRTYFAILALTLVMLTGCRSTQPVAEQPTASSPAVQTIQTEYYEGNFDASYEGISASGLLRMEKDSAIWVTLSKFIEMGRAIATPDSVHVYVKITGAYFHGTYADVEKKCGIKTNFDSLQNLLFKKAETLGRTSDVCLPRYNNKICTRVKFNKFKRSATPLTFPMNIPASAKPLFR